MPIERTSNSSPLTAALGLAAALVLAGPLAARGDPPPVDQVEPRSEDLAAAGLEQTPMVVASLGLRMYLPIGTIADLEREGGRVLVRLQDGEFAVPPPEQSPPPRWSMQVQRMESSDASRTALQEVEDNLESLRQANAEFEVIESRVFHPIGLGAPGQLCYIRRTTSTGQAFVAGWLVAPTGPGSFVVFSVLTIPDHVEYVQRRLGASFGTIRLRNEADVVAEREARLAAGAALIASLDEARLREAVGRANWFRIYRPAASPTQGDREIGYALIEILAGPRGALTPNRAPEAYDAMQREEGLLVSVHGRIVSDAKTDIYLDNEFLYWMAWDGREEAWSIRATYRQGDVSRSESETGVRSPLVGDTRSRLTVVRARATTFEEPYEWEVPDVYVSQALGWLVGAMPPAEIPAEVSYYSFQATGGTPRMTLRIDRWEPSRVYGSAWLHSTRTSGENPVTKTWYDEDGRMVRRDRPDGSVTTPTDLESLRRRWNTAGLKIAEQRSGRRGR